MNYPEDLSYDRQGQRSKSIWDMIDRQATLARLAGDERLFGELVEFFLADHEPLMSTLMSAADRLDAGALERAAHSLKGQSANLGAMGVAAIAGELEAAAQRGDWPAVDAALPRIDAGLARLLAAMRCYQSGRT